MCAAHQYVDNPDGLKPSHHSFYSERIAWFDITDDLPRYEGLLVDSSLLLVLLNFVADKFYEDIRRVWCRIGRS